MIRRTFFGALAGFFGGSLLAKPTENKKIHIDGCYRLPEPKMLMKNGEWANIYGMSYEGDTYEDLVRHIYKQVGHLSSLAYYDYDQEKKVFYFANIRSIVFCYVFVEPFVKNSKWRCKIGLCRSMVDKIDESFLASIPMDEYKAYAIVDQKF